MFSFSTKLLTILALLGGLVISARAQQEPDIHLNSIRMSSYKKQADQGVRGDSAFLEFVINNLLERPEDVAFLSNRDLLTPLCIKHCGRSEVIVYDTLKDNRIVDVHLHTTPFDSVAHTFSYFPGEDSLVEMIDSMPAYGAVYQRPVMMIDSIGIIWGGKSLTVPATAYRDMYDPNLCDSDIFHQPVMAYPSLSGDYLYVYLFGGKGRDSYFAKLIFDQDRYIKKIVTEYQDLVDYDAFRWDFLGY